MTLEEIQACYGRRAHITRDPDLCCWWVLRPYASGYLDWGLTVLRVEDDGYVSAEWSHPCYLSSDYYGSDDGREWTAAEWREALEALAADEIAAAIERGLP